MQDNIERHAAWSLLRSVNTSMEAVCGPDALKRSRLPDDLHISRVTHGARRLDQDGEAVIMTALPANKIRKVLPEDCSLAGRLIIHNVVDRHSTNVSGCSFMSSLPYLWCTSYGIFHDMWNSIRHASKAAKVGRATNWDFVQKAAAVFNLNHGPFRSGVWGRQKQQVMSEHMQSHEPNDSRFRAAAMNQMPLDGREDCSDENFNVYWHKLACFPSVVSAGPACKFSRWMSINECWRFTRGEVWLVQLVLQEMGGSPDPMAELLVASANALDVILSGDGRGLLERVPSTSAKN